MNLSVPNDSVYGPCDKRGVDLSTLRDGDNVKLVSGGCGGSLFSCKATAVVRDGAEVMFVSPGWAPSYGNEFDRHNNWVEIDNGDKST